MTVVIQGGGNSSNSTQLPLINGEDEGNLGISNDALISSASSCINSHGRNEEATYDSKLISLNDKLYTYTDTETGLISDEELGAFFECTRTADCLNVSSPFLS